MQDLQVKGTAAEAAKNAITYDDHNKSLVTSFMVAESKKHQEELNKSLKRYRLLANNASEAIIIVQDGMHEFVNPKAVELSGYTEKELLNKPFADLIYPEDKDDVLLRINKKMHGEIARDNYSFRYITKDGSVRWADFNTAGVEWEGRPATLALITDITRRKRAEQDIIEGHQNMLSVLDNMGAMVYVVDMESYEILFVNQYTREEFGDMVGEKCWQVIQVGQAGPCDFCNNDKLLDAAGQPTGVCQREFKNTRNNRWYDCRSIAFRWINGSMVRMEMATDITHQKERQEEIQKERNELKNLLEEMLDTTAVWIAIMDVDGDITFWNRAAEQISGYTEEEVTGNSSIWEWLVPDPDNRAEFCKKCQDSFHNGKRIENYEMQIKRKDGQYRTLLFYYSSLLEKGKVTGGISLGVDITEKKALEQELFKADKLESIGILAGGIAHDFNNYLTALLGNISLIRLQAEDSQKVLGKMETLEKATLRAKHLSTQLSAFAEGAKPVKKTAFINQSIINDVQFTLSGSNVSCNYFIDENLSMVEIDEGQFSQVIINIVTNARQAMPQGGEITITAENVTVRDNCLAFLLSPGNYVKISIRDQGIGIPKEYLNKIFDPFFTTREKGRGLGLATSYTIIKNHGGHIGVEFEKGLGTTFYIYLPASTRTIAPAPDKVEIFRGKGRILVMDDQEDLLEVAQEILTAFGYHVSLARNGQEAIESYREAFKKDSPFDLVIMDLTVPGGMGGKDTIKELLKLDPGAKAIVSSGYSRDPVMADFRDYGFKGVLKKPYSMEELSQVVDKIIRSEESD